MPTASTPPLPGLNDAWVPSAAARLLLACTGPLHLGSAVRPGDRAPAQQAGSLPDRCTAGVDWAEFAALTTRHAAAPLVQRALSGSPLADMPATLRIELRRHAQVNRLRNRVLLEELVRITAAARAAGVPLVPYKGPVLAHQLYGDIGLRVSSDLDLLTTLADVDRAAGVVRALGYRFAPLRGQRAQQAAAANLRHWHCYNFIGDRPRLAVDLHVRFAPAHFPVAADLSTFAGRLTTCTVGGHDFACFGDDDLLVLLAMHAAKDLMWRRLTWFSEIAVLAHRLPPAGLSRALDTATRIGCRRLLLLALLLVQRLYGLPAGYGWPAGSRERARLQPLAEATLRRLFAPTVAEPPRLQVHFVTHPALRERRRDRWASYAAGLHALVELLRPPSSGPAPPASAAVLRYPAYWVRAAVRRARRLAAGWAGLRGRS